MILVTRRSGGAYCPRPTVGEDGTTLVKTPPQERAFASTSLPGVADDTGLEVDALTRTGVQRRALHGEHARYDDTGQDARRAR